MWDDDAGAGRRPVPSSSAFRSPRISTALLARDDLDGVVISTPTNEHRDVMVKAAQAGKHIFTEKVLAPTVAEAEEIIAAADDNGVKLVVSLPRLAHGLHAGDHVT